MHFEATYDNMRRTRKKVGHGISVTLVLGTTGITPITSKKTQYTPKLSTLFQRLWICSLFVNDYYWFIILLWLFYKNFTMIFLPSRKKSCHRKNVREKVGFDYQIKDIAEGWTVIQLKKGGSHWWSNSSNSLSKLIVIAKGFFIKKIFLAGTFFAKNCCYFFVRCSLSQTLSELNKNDLIYIFSRLRTIKFKYGNEH